MQQSFRYVFITERGHTNYTHINRIELINIIKDCGKYCKNNYGQTIPSRSGVFIAHSTTHYARTNTGSFWGNINLNYQLKKPQVENHIHAILANKTNSQPTSQEVRYVLQLGYIVLPVAAVLYEQREHVVVLPARVFRIQLRQLPEHHAPSFDLLFRVVHPRNWLSTMTNKTRTLW